MDKNVTIITDPEGKKIVLINDIRFKGKRKEEWKEIEDYLKEYIGEYSEITETAEKIYIGSDFPDEFTHGKDKTILKGSNLKAKYGWYRYDTRLALPVYNDYGEIERYNVFRMRMLVRHDEDGKLYLYDFLRTKKETSSPLE
mgnify:CR=1 FL=1